MKIIFDTSLANEKGKKLEHPDLYHQRLMLRTGSYVKASTIMFQRFHIRFYIEP